MHCSFFAVHSVLTGVMDQTKSLMADVGAEDKARLDEYFSGLRNLEHQFDLQLTKPKPIAACHPQGADSSSPCPV